MPVTFRRFSALLALGAVIATVWGGLTLLKDSPVDASPAPQTTPVFGPVITAAANGGTPAAAPTLAPTASLTASAPSPTPPLALSPTAARAGTPTPTPFIILTPLPALRADLMGIQIDPNLTEEAYNTMLWLAKRLGVKWIKIQFDWSLLEPQQGVLSEKFYSYQLYVQRADQEGFNVMASIAKAPAWARASAEEDGPPRDPADLGRFFVLMQNAIGLDMFGNSYFEAIEVWNEPNLRREWNGGTLSGAEYMRLFDATYHAIRSAAGTQNLVIITAGLAPTGINDGGEAIDDRAYLRQMYDAGLNNAGYQGIAIGVHPYGAGNPPDARCCGTGDYDWHPTWFFLNTLEDYHAIMQQYGDTSRQLWATEFGWGTFDGFLTAEGDPAPAPADPPYFRQISEVDQGNYIIRAFELAQSMPYVGPMMLWNLNYGGQAYVDLQDPQAAYAILKETINPLRPAFIMIESAPKR